MVRWWTDDACSKLAAEVETRSLRLTYFDGLTIHLSLNCFFQSQQRDMHGILQFETVRVPLFQESFGARCTLPNGGSFPGEIAATGIYLVKTWPSLEYPPRFT